MVGNIMFINLTPFVPLSFKREGFCPSLTYTPPSLNKGRGQGDRLLNNLVKTTVVSRAY